MRFRACQFKALVTMVFAIGAFTTPAWAAARSVQVNFTNSSDVALTLSSDSLSHGCWTTQPPNTIAVGASVSWESESCGVATGTEGEATYTFAAGGSAHFHWDNPFVGSNSYDQSAPVGYSAIRSGGDGNNATVSWTFDCSSATCDGIPDDWKRNGVTIDPGDGSGPQFIDLPNMGATVNKPDVFVQLDWMANSSHSHQLSSAAIQTVVTAFANSPFVSRTGSVGINLHVDEGPGSILNFATSATWGSLGRAKQLTEVTNLGTGTVNSYSWSAFDTIKNAVGGFKSTGRLAIFHYVISAHQISNLGNSGVARSTPGSDFIISLASCCTVTPTVNQQEGTLMHELGHNLGLAHGGGDPINNKPNYLSVMNYSFQFNGLTENGVANIYDYSRAALNTLGETSLTESAGVGAAASKIATSHWCPAAGGNPAAFVTVADASQSIDWNCNGVATDTGVSFDVNNDGLKTSLAPFNDWANLQLKGGSIGVGGDAQQPSHTPVDEITAEQQALIQPLDTTPPVTVAAITPPPNSAGWNRTDVSVSLVATDDISGVARTEQDLDGAGFSAYAGPIVITAEGVHILKFRSIDRAQNVEATKQIDIRIDKTPPEADISYDPQTHQIVVTGRDALSGTAPGPVVPTSVVPTIWTDFGSDITELRTYHIVDLAGNSMEIAIKVKLGNRELEAGVVGVRYSDDGRGCKNEPGNGNNPGKENRQKQRGKKGKPGNSSGYNRGPDCQGYPELKAPQKNTIVFGRLRGRGLDKALLAVWQEVDLDRGASRTTVEASYNVLCDETMFAMTPPEPASEKEAQGLIRVHILTDKGKLKVECPSGLCSP
jgi:hypothetical protein